MAAQWRPGRLLKAVTIRCGASHRLGLMPQYQYQLHHVSNGPHGAQPCYLLTSTKLLLIRMAIEWMTALILCIASSILSAWSMTRFLSTFHLASIAQAQSSTALSPSLSQGEERWEFYDKILTGFYTQHLEKSGARRPPCAGHLGRHIFFVDIMHERFR